MFAECFYQHLYSFTTIIYQRDFTRGNVEESKSIIVIVRFWTLRSYAQSIEFANWTNSQRPRPANRLVLLTWTPRVRACGRALIGGSLLAYIHKTSSIPLGHRLHLDITAQLSCISSLAFLFHAAAKAVVPFVIITLKPERFKRFYRLLI